MRLAPDDLTYLSQCAITAATQAGALIQRYANKNVAVQHKSGGDSPAAQVVTEVDLLSEAIIVKALTPSCQQYDLALLTEETTDDKARLQKDYFWCVDPMDGTLAFTESTPGYSVSIALVAQNGMPLIGVIYDPVTHNVYSAVRGQGARRNGEPWFVVSSLTGATPLTHICDRGFMQQAYYPAVSSALESLAVAQGLSAVQVRQRNGAVLNACAVLEMAPACYFKFPKAEEGGGSLWDFAATAALFLELGLIASDFYGQPLELNRAGSSYMNHRGVLFSTDPLLATGIQGLLALSDNN
jgi:3'(2'), 5'-bisphosphate nucleotidase/myo-inositol-1(or 4)-monophosphatase